MNRIVSDRIIDRHELKSMVPFSATHIARLEKAGQFPKRIQIGTNRVGWCSAEVQEWVRTKIDLRDTMPPADNKEEGGNSETVKPSTLHLTPTATATINIKDKQNAS